MDNCVHGIERCQEPECGKSDKEGDEWQGDYPLALNHPMVQAGGEATIVVRPQITVEAIRFAVAPEYAHAFRVLSLMIGRHEILSGRSDDLGYAATLFPPVPKSVRGWRFRNVSGMALVAQNITLRVRNVTGMNSAFYSMLLTKRAREDAYYGGPYYGGRVEDYAAYDATQPTGFQKSLAVVVRKGQVWKNVNPGYHDGARFIVDCLGTLNGQGHVWYRKEGEEHLPPRSTYLTTWRTFFTLVSEAMPIPAPVIAAATAAVHPPLAKCIACGHPCRESLFSTSEGCTNSRCKFSEGYSNG